MSLSCSCDDGPEVFREKLVVARKQHKCYECHAKIISGDLYEYTFGVWDGVALSFHTCEKCSDLRASLLELGFCSEYGDLLSEHQEYITEYVNY